MIQKYLAIIFLFLIGCKPIEPVNFVEVQNVKINSSTDNQINISAEIVLDNPNKVKITIEYIDVNIFAAMFPPDSFVTLAALRAMKINIAKATMYIPLLM